MIVFLGWRIPRYVKIIKPIAASTIPASVTNGALVSPALTANNGKGRTPTPIMVLIKIVVA
jgi:hypothetical protein